MIGYQPSDWPFKSRATPPIPDDAQLTDSLKQQIAASKASQRPIRYLVYRNKKGEFRADWWYEDDVQKMLTETGIEVPEPTPFYPERQKAQKAPETVNTPKSIDENETIKVSEPIIMINSGEESTSLEKSAPESKPMWPWAVAGLALLAGIGWILSSRKNK